MQELDDSHLVWMDLEMTGLDPGVHVIIEIATIITDKELTLVAEGPVLAIHQGEKRLREMDEWNQTHHRDSGLVDRVRASEVTEAQAEKDSLEFVSRYVAPGIAPLCGNSIWQDRRFLARYMPELEAHFHYRVIDVSSIKELARRWRPELLTGFHKKGEHLALADIRESIEELRYYRENFFRS
ncbi:MAG: oligoribonuclease [Pseudomonadales bacterium]